MTDQTHPHCPLCGMLFPDITEEELPYKILNHGWVTSEAVYERCADASLEGREAFREAKRVIQARNVEAKKAAKDLQKGIIAKGFEGKGKEQLGM